jgi:acyl-CoA thioesterase
VARGRFAPERPALVSCASVQRGFDAATAVEPAGEGRYGGRIDAGWDIAGNANGGYLLAMGARAMADTVGRPPLSVTAHYLSPGRVGACEIAVEVLRGGRRMATVAARLRSNGDDVLALLGTFADQAPGGPSAVDLEPPELPPFEACVRSVPPAEGSGFGDRVHVRVRPDDAGFRDGTPTGRAEIRGWFSFSDAAPGDQQIDAFGLLQAVDAFAPVCFNLDRIPVGWAPTLELTVHVRGTPAPGALRCRFRSHFVQDGLFEEDGEVWDSAGKLVAQSRQLALIPRG